MQISPETLTLLCNLGIEPAKLADLFKALERDWQAYSQPATASGENEERERLRNRSTYAERKRAKDRERQRQLREIARQSRDPPATSRDIDGDPPATEGDATATTRDEAPHVCAGKYPLSSSLRSEGIPPEKPSVSTPKGADKRGGRLPEGWRPDESGWAYAVEQLGSEPLAQGQLDRFRDYWRGVPGAKGRKLDWPGTWRNWVRRAVENQPRKAHDRPHPEDKLARKEANLARAFAGAERASGRDWKP